MTYVTVDRRLWLSDLGALVEEGDPDAAFLWAGEGQSVTQDEADRVGYQPARSARPPDPEVPAEVPVRKKRVKAS